MKSIENAYDLREELSEIPALTGRQIRDGRAAIRTIVSQLLPTGSPVDAAALERFKLDDLVALHGQLEALPATCIGIAPRSMQQTISRFRGILRAAGLAIPNGRGQAALLPAWSEFLASRSASERQALRPFSHAASARGLPPEAVNDGLMTDYGRDLLARCGTKGSIQRLRALHRTWNTVARAAGLTSLQNPVPYADRDSYAIAEVELAETVRVGLDLISRRPAKHSGRGWDGERKEYLVRLATGAYCHAKQRSAGSIVSLRAVVDEAEVALGFMIDRAQDRTPGADRTAGAYEVARALLHAGRALEASTSSINRLEAIVTSLAPPADTVLTPRKQATLRVFTEPNFARTFRMAPSRIYATARPDSEFSRPEGTRLMLACALELAMATSLWPYQLARLELDRHLLVDSSGRWFVDLPADESAHGVAKRHLLSPSSAVILVTYIERVRPVRPGANSLYLFPGRGGSYNPGGFSQAVADLVEAETGHRVAVGDLPDAIAVVLVNAPGGGPALAQGFMGRTGPGPDPLITTATTWLRARNADRRLGR